MLNKYIIPISWDEKPKLSLVGGKGLNLVKLVKIKDLNIPGGFIVTTKVFEDFLKNNKIEMNDKAKNR